ncbi:MAG: TolC family protein, partial [Bdellovibrionales bacterium]|nr:TolC family protein [Oligoflexia bacterium]
MFLFLLTLFASNAFSRVLTWSDCVELVSKNNPELAAARSNYSSTQELQSGSIGNYLPSLTASVNANYNFPNSSTSNPTFTSVGGAVISTNQSSKVAYSSALTLNYNLFSGFRDRASYDRAKANCAIASAGLDLVRSQISYRLRQAFVELDYAQEYIKLTDSIIERRSQNERLVRAQYESGRENQGSYLLSQSVLE